DRVVLVRVALGALDRQPKRRGADDLERVVERLEVVAGRVLDAGEVGPAGIGGAAEKAGGFKRFDDLLAQLLLRRARGPVIDQLVAGDLLLEKAIIRLVLVEGADDPVAVA